MATVDFLLYNNLQPVRVLQVPNFEILQGHEVAPNEIFPSDHISILAEFNIT